MSYRKIDLYESFQGDHGLSIKECEDEKYYRVTACKSFRQKLKDSNRKGFSPTSQFVRWTLHTRSTVLVLVSGILLVSLTLIFALVIITVARLEPRCVTTNIYAEGTSFSSRLIDAWQLSWTTFTTVGYGVISPATGASFNLSSDMEKFRDNGSCALMSIILSLECLIGILYNSLAGAIIFGILTKFQSNAQVKFSSVIVVRFGENADNFLSGDDSSDSSESSNGGAQEKLPCPRLVFRIANLLKGHEKQIINANIQATATINLNNAIVPTSTADVHFSGALQSTTNLMQGARHNAHHSITSVSPGKTFNKMSHSLHHLTDVAKSKVKNISHGKPKSDTSISLEAVSKDLRNSTLMNFGMSVKQIKSLGHDIDVNETLGSIIIHDEAQVERPNLVFSRISLDPQDHPCFTTVWHAVHVLDKNSPLLDKSVRKKVADNDNYWPCDMNSKEHVKESIKFDQLMVNLSGTSTATDSDVYSNYVYKKENLRVGYHFKSMLIAFNNTICAEPDDIDLIKKQTDE